MFKYVTKFIGTIICVLSIILFSFFARAIGKIDAFDIFFIGMCILSFVGGLIIMFIDKILNFDNILSNDDEYVLGIDIDEDLLNTYLEICTMHHKYAPKLRTGQLIDNYKVWLYKNKKLDMFYISDKLLVEYFKEYIESIRYIN